MLQYLIRLESPDLDAGPVDAHALIAYALTCGDHWASLAVGHLEAGLLVADLAEQLRVLSQDRRRSQSLRHRAYRLVKYAAPSGKDRRFPS